MIMEKEKDQSQKPLVSVIVPVYNTKTYLEQCLESLCSQSLKNVEFILIDDGSTDGSGGICDYYSIKDPRFRVIHKKNEGLAAARNDGINLVRADYIMFVDSDDWVEKEFCEIPWRIAIDNEADIVGFQYIKHGKKREKRPPFPKEGIIEKEQVLTIYWPYLFATCWNKIYNKKLFLGIEYPVGHFSEDIAVTHRLVYKSKQVYLINQYLYNYRMYRQNSITNTRSLQHIEDHFYFSFLWIEDLKRWGLEYKSEEEKLALQYLVIFGRNGVYSTTCRKILHKMNTDLQNASLRIRVMLHIYKISPMLFDAICILTGKRRVCALSQSEMSYCIPFRTNVQRHSSTK